MPHTNHNKIPAWSWIAPAFALVLLGMKSTGLIPVDHPAILIVSALLLGAAACSTLAIDVSELVSWWVTPAAGADSATVAPVAVTTRAAAARVGKTRLEDRARGTRTPRAATRWRAAWWRPR